MPIENERKYIIDLHRNDAETILRDYNGKWYRIEQAYINDGRIRKITQFNSETGQQETEYMFTWKKRRPDMSLIEIETSISKNDFVELWNMADIIVSKLRVKISGYGVTWDVDFLEKYDISTKTFSNHYLTIAEVEMPEDWDEPNVLPSFVTDNLLWLVPRDKDTKWSNRNLSDPVKVKKMLDKVLNRKE